jgi:hypothetical protein
MRLVDCIVACDGLRIGLPIRAVRLGRWPRSRFVRPPVCRAYNSQRMTSDDDYRWIPKGDVAAARAQASASEFAARPELVAATQAQWHQTADPCVFAAFMSARRIDVGWTTVVLAPRASPPAVAEAVAAHVEGALSDAATEIISILLPHLRSASDVAGLAGALPKHSGWSWTEVARERDRTHGALVLLGLRVSLGEGVLSEVLGFGPLVTFPRTRGAPFTELVVRAAPGPWREDPNRAHMADVPLDLEQDTITAMLDQTRKNRRRTLSEAEQQRAKAKVTFTLPAAAWEA